MTNRSTPVPDRSRRPVRAALAVAFIGVIAGLYACAPKITKVDTSYTMPEGVFSNEAQMIIWADQPTIAYIYADKIPADPDPADSLMETETYERYDAHALHGLIIDHTQADAFQLFRREAGGGVRQFANYSASPSRQWLASQYEAFHFVDPVPSSYRPATYIARGVVEGVVNDRSPLTNVATATVPALVDIPIRAVWWNNHDATKGPVYAFPKIKLKWDRVPGAVRYLLQIYEFRGDLRSDQERILAGSPAPMYDGQSSDIYFGYLPGDLDFMFVGDSARTDLQTIAARPLATGATYIARLAALDASGRMIGLSIGAADPQTAFQNKSMGLQRGVRGNNTYRLYRYCGTTTQDTVTVNGPPGGGLG